MAAISSTPYSRLEDNDDKEHSGSERFDELLVKQEQIEREQDEDLVLAGN